MYARNEPHLSVVIFPRQLSGLQTSVGMLLCEARCIALKVRVMLLRFWRELDENCKMSDRTGVGGSLAKRPGGGAAGGSGSHHAYLEAFGLGLGEWNDVIAARCLARSGDRGRMT